MSSTNRGYDRHKADYYVTPIQPIKDFFSHFLVDEKIDRPDRMNFLDPCAGGDEFNDMSYPTVIEGEFGAPVTSIDIREDSRADIIMDFLEAKMENFDRHEIIITNPPFDIAMSIIRKSLEIAPDNGYVIMLLRLNFFGSKDRFSFFEEFMPKYCYVHHKRISFIPENIQKKIISEGGKRMSSDSIEYAHFVWQKGFETEFTKLKVI